MAKSDYKKTMSELGAKLKDEPVKTPIQEVRPVEPARTAPAKTEINETPKKEAHVNFWVPDELMERLKIHAAKSRKTIKQIGVEALEQYLGKHE